MMQERLWNVIASKIGRPGVFEIEFHRKQKTSPELTASMLIPLAIFFSFFLPSIYTHIRYRYIYIYILLALMQAYQWYIHCSRCHSIKSRLPTSPAGIYRVGKAQYFTPGHIHTIILPCGWPSKLVLKLAASFSSRERTRALLQRSSYTLRSPVKGSIPFWTSTLYLNIYFKSLLSVNSHITHCLLYMLLEGNTIVQAITYLGNMNNINNNKWHT